MLERTRVVAVGAFLSLAFSLGAAAQPLGLIAGPVPVGTEASFNGAQCKVRSHAFANRVIRIRNGTGAIVAQRVDFQQPGNDYVLNASFFLLGGAGARAVCEVFPVFVDSQPNTPDVVDAQSTLTTRTWFGDEIETVPGVTGNTGPGPWVALPPN